MVSVRTQPKVSLSESQAQRAMSLERYLRYLADEFNTTVAALRDYGIDANVSVSGDGAAPGN